jgi:hypothetical protein
VPSGIAEAISEQIAASFGTWAFADRGRHSPVSYSSRDPPVPPPPPVQAV